MVGTPVVVMCNTAHSSWKHLDIILSNIAWDLIFLHFENEELVKHKVYFIILI